MFEFLLWIVFGATSGWIGYIATKTDKTSPRLYLVVGIASAVISGYLTRMLAPSDGIMALNVNSLFFALVTSIFSIAIVGFFRVASTDQ